MYTDFKFKPTLLWPGTKKQQNHAQIPMWRKTEPDVNSHNVISVGNKCGSFSAIIRDIWTKFGTELKKQTTIMTDCAKFTYHGHPRRRRPPYWMSINVNISGLDEDISAAFGGQIHHGYNMEMIAGTLMTLSTTRWLSAYMYSIALATSTTSRF